MLDLTLIFIFSSASNRIIHAKDHASIQLNIAEVSNYFPLLFLNACGMIAEFVINVWNA